MSRSVSLQWKYRNGQVAFSGWHCPKNSDKVASSFTRDSLNKLILNLKEEKGGRIMATNLVDIKVTVSNSYGESLTWEANFHIDNVIRAFKSIDHILNFTGEYYG